MATQANEVAPTAKAAKKAKTQKAPVAGPFIKLTDKKPEYKAGSARALWYTALAKADGRSSEEFVEAASKKPPALTKSGTAESPASWLRYFMREGLTKVG